MSLLVRRVEGVPKERVQSTEEDGGDGAKEYISAVSSKGLLWWLGIEKSMEKKLAWWVWNMPHEHGPAMFPWEPPLHLLLCIIVCFLSSFFSCCCFNLWMDEQSLQLVFEFIGLRQKNERNTLLTMGFVRMRWKKGWKLGGLIILQVKFGKRY